MAKILHLDLSKPHTGLKGIVTRIEWREPTFIEISEYGEPFKWHPTYDGKRVFVEDTKALAAYARLCLISGIDGLDALESLGVADSKAALETVGRFFLPDPPKAPDDGSTTSPSSS